VRGPAGGVAPLPGYHLLTAVTRWRLALRGRSLGSMTVEEVMKSTTPMR